MTLGYAVKTSPCMLEGTAMPASVRPLGHSRPCRSSEPASPAWWCSRRPRTGAWAPDARRDKDEDRCPSSLRHGAAGARLEDVMDRFVGIDVGKTHLDIALLPEATTFGWPTTPPLATLITRLGAPRPPRC